MDDPEAVEYVTIPRDRLERLMDAAMLAQDDELFPLNLEPGDLDPVEPHPAPPD